MYIEKAAEMAQQEKALVAKPGDLSLIPGLGIKKNALNFYSEVVL